METSMPRSSIIKWKWFTQDHATARTQGGDTPQQGGFFPLALSLEIHEELLDFVVTWTLPYKKLSSNQQRAAWFMISRSKVNGKHSIWKDTIVTTEGKNRSARWTELHAACHDILVVTYSLAVTNGLAIWSGRRTTEKVPIKWMSLWGIALWKLLWEFERCIKVGHANAHQKNLQIGRAHV